jgi:polar amino acid transport system substrate-binding protein
MKRIILVLMMICSLGLPPSAYAVKIIKLWTYYDYPPFITDIAAKRGLTYDFADFLGKHPKNKGRYQFDVQILPRKRIDTYLMEGKQGIVVWTNPLFFDDQAKLKYRWTTALWSDSQDVISLVEKPVEYSGAASSLFGLRIGGVLGHNYIGIQKEMDEKLILRNDVLRDEVNIQHLLHKWIDALLIARSTMNIYEKELRLKGKIHYSKIPLNRYTRHLLLQRSLEEDLYVFLQQVIDSGSLPEKKSWQMLLQKYEIWP